MDDIIDSLYNIEEDIEGANFDEFDRDSRRKDAVIRNFEIIGEATKKLSDNKKIYPIVPLEKNSKNS